ncbi:hypothetical protein ACQKWADRAFT_297339 [Trichoderma austrokoningii]
MSERPSRREDFEIAIICALPLEFDAISLLFDEFWDEHGDTFGRVPGDSNHYTTGRISKHNVVLALLPHMGKAHAASAAANMRSSYGGLRLVILAGVCGGVPQNDENEMFLGDVVISSSVIQFDFGRHYPNGFVRKDTYEDNLRKHDKNISGLLRKFGTDIGQDKLHERAAHFLKQLQAVKHRDKYRYPGTDKDKLFEPSYRHKHRDSAACICSSCHGRKDPVCDEALGSSCDELGCDEEYLVERIRLREQDKAQEPAIYLGAVASGDTVMKSGEDRDRIAKKEGVIAFEMEGAGAWEDLPCIVVKGICDYADSHKNKQFQNFAAATAASVSKAILEQYIQTDRTRGRLIEESPKSHFLVPFGQNQNFVGRDAILSSLLKKIRPDANKEDCQRTAIEGLGGVGKTQIALEAVYRLHNEHPGCSIFWVPAVDATGFENAYRNIGEHLKIKGIDQDEADVKLLVKAALSGESSGSWLMVIDNADDNTLLFGDTGLSAHLPFNRNGSILFTTRFHEAAVRLDILAESIFSVMELSQVEALGLLRKGLKESQVNDVEATEKLLEVLANLPLAIRQASAFMAIKHISTADYLELCQSNTKDMITLLSRDFEDRHRYKEIQNPVATTWLISFNQILRNDPLAAKYLQFMSILAEKDVPKFLLPRSTRLEGVEAIGTLKGYAFITEQEGEDLFNMHRLVRLAMRNWLEKEGRLKKSVASAIQRLHKEMPWPEHENRNTWMRCLPHAQAILELPEHLTDTEAGAWLFAYSADCDRLSGRYQAAESMHRRALELNEKLLGKDHRNVLVNKSKVGIALHCLGRYSEAEKIFRQVFEVREKLLGKDHLDTLDSMSFLANTLIVLGRSEEAEKMLRHVLSMQQKLLSKDDLTILNSMDGLARALRELGKYEESKKIYHQIFKKREEIHGIDHPRTLYSMESYAIMLEKLGKYEESEGMHYQAWKLKEMVLGTDHPETLISMDNVAAVLGNLGKHEESEKMHHQAFKRAGKVLGKHHLHTLKIMDNFAIALDQVGNYEGSEKLHREAIKLKEEAFGKDALETQKSRDNLAGFLERRKRNGKRDAV